MNAGRAGVIYLAGNLLSAGVPFLLLPLLTRLLPPAEYGAVVNFFLLTTACSALAGLGVHGAVGVAWFRESREDLPRVVGSAVAIAVVSTLATMLLVGLAFSPLAPERFGFGPGMAALAALSAGAAVLLQCRLVLWQSQQRPLPNAALQITASASNVGLSLVGVMLLGWAGQGRMAGAAAAAILMAVLAVALLARAGHLVLAPTRQDLGKLLAFGVPLIPHVLAGILLTNADRLVVSAGFGPQALGLYGAAAQLGAVMAIIADAFVKAFNPWLYARLSATDPQDGLRAVGAIYAAVPGFLALALVVGALLGSVGLLMLGPAYRAAGDLLPWFILGGAFSGIYLAVSGLYFFHGRTARLSSVSLPTVAVGVVGTMLLASRHGMAGAAAGYALTQGLLALFAWLVARHTFDLPWGRPATALQAWGRFVLARPGGRTT